jgi:hypothetical protein
VREQTIGALRTLRNLVDLVHARLSARDGRSG